MTGKRVEPRRIRPPMLLAMTAVLLTFIVAPSLSLAQTAIEPTYFARTDLNMRKGPGATDAIFMTIPMGAEIARRPGEVTNDYAPVTYKGVDGWVVALGMVTSPGDIGLAPVEEVPAAPENTLTLYEQGVRETLVPLMLRSGPDIEAEPIAGMPEGSLVTLTREGWENGYVTVDYGGAQGWAYAELLGPPAPGR